MNKVPLLCALLFLAFTHAASAQQRSKPKKLSTKEEYIHSATGTVFPMLLLEEYQRSAVYSFDKPNTNIGVNYRGHGTTMTIYIYPAGNGYEDRLRSEYWTGLRMAANSARKDIEIGQWPVKHTGQDYICNGFNAIYETEQNALSLLSVYECGSWFFKIRATSGSLDSLGLRDLERSIANHFDPGSLTAAQPLSPQATVSFADGAFRDSLMLLSSMAAAYEKVGWVIENVPENERASGFPGIYLDMHMESLKACVEVGKEHNFETVTPETRKYLDELNSIIDARYLAEFIMTQFGMVMAVVPEGRVFNYKGFELWEKNNPISIDMNAMYYLLYYERQNTKEK